MGYKVYKELINATTAVTATAWFDIGDARLFALQTEYGSITGAFTVAERLGADITDTTFSYVTNTNISITAPADATGGEVLHYDAGAAQFYIRIRAEQLP
jgi:hypothetical protein